MIKITAIQGFTYKHKIEISLASNRRKLYGFLISIFLC